jgi:succinoglycan biosynthesis protein ExoV
MRLYYYAGTNGIRNFGDELNHHVWPRVCPGIFDDSPDGAQFIGIGTLLNDHVPPAPRTVVFGSGVGYYGPPPRNPGWEIHCVRGPLSAEALGLPASAAVTDPGILAPRVFDLGPRPRTSWQFAFMPHWQTAPDEWRPICERIGFGFIDPRWEPARVLDALRRTDVVLTEAMHGAIVADALRIPWVAVRTREHIKSFKWEDWCRSMALTYAPVSLPTIWHPAANAGVVRRARRWARLQLVARLLRRAAHTARPSLSRDDVFQARLAALDERLEALRLREGLVAA